MRSTRLTQLAVAAALGGAGLNTHEIAAARQPSTVVITENEIAAANVNDAYTVVERLRPEFFRARGHTSITGTMSDFANVYLGTHVYGDLTSLKTITANQVHEIRYWNAQEASLKFGMANSKGVIQVLLK